MSSSKSDAWLVVYEDEGFRLLAKGVFPRPRRLSLHVIQFLFLDSFSGLARHGLLFVMIAMFFVVLLMICASFSNEMMV